MPLSETGSGYGINFGVIEKFFAESLYFSPSHDLPLEGDFKNYSESTHKNSCSHSLLSEGIYRKMAITRKFYLQALIFHRSRDLPLEREKVFSGTLKIALSNGLTSGGVSQVHPTPSQEKELITTRQLNNRHRNRYDLATIWARRRCGAAERSRGRHTKTVSEGRRSIPISN